MAKFDTRITPQGKVLQDYWDSDKATQVIRGPLGSGKTILTCNKILHLMTQQAPNKQGVRLSRWLAVRNSYSELFSTTIKDWLEINGHYGEFNQGGKKAPTHKLRFMLSDGTRVESELMFISFDKPHDVKKAKGLQLTGVWCNEASQLPRSAIQMLDLRHGRYPSKKEGVECSWHGMVMDTNSFDTDHWLFDVAHDVPDDWGFFHQPAGVVKVGGKWEENPRAENLSNLPKGYYRKGVQGKTEDWIKLNLANEYGFVSEGKPVHPQFQDSVHCLDLQWKPDRRFPIILGFDWGRTPACTMMQKTSMGGWIVFDEFISEDMSAALYAPELKRYLSSNYEGFDFKGWGDPAGEQKGQATEMTPFKVVRNSGIPCRPTEKSNDIILRRSSVDLPLTQLGMDGLSRLVILPKCSMLRKGLAGGFCYKRVLAGGDERFKDIPDKNKYSHVCEALEYALVGEGEGKKALKTFSSDPYDDWSRPINV